MSRLTGSDALGLFEAYQAVYVPQELTEEQVWEEVENWVNSLVEEWYDLSDYTWEEMYEFYIEEATKPETINLKPQKGVTAGGNVTLGRGYEATLGGKKGQTSYVRGSDGGFKKTFREYGSEVNPPSAADAKKSEADPRRNPTPKPTSTATPKPTSTATPKPTSTVTPKPTSTATTKPTSTVTPTTKPTGPAIGMLGKTSFERRTPTSSELKAAQSARASGASPEKALQAAKSAGGALSQATAAASKPAAFNPSSMPTAAATAPSPVNRATGSKKPGSIVSGFDLFDVVKGHLIDEGYADTEESALAIMANMSEEWKESIVDEGFKKMNRGKIERQAKKLGGDKEIILRSLSNMVDTPEWRKRSTSQARKNRAGSGSEYRKGKELQARDDARADIKKYGLR